MDFGLAFSYIFKDANWFKKLIIPALVALIPILGQIVVLGWVLKITQRVILRDPEPLPELDFSGDLGRGFKAFVVGLVYGLPFAVIYIPIAILVAIGANSGMDTEAIGVILTIAMVCMYALMGLYGLVLAFIMPAAYANMVVKGSIGAGLKLGEIFGLVKKAPGAYLMTILGSIIVGIIAPLGSIACGVGVLLTTTFGMAVMGHLYGQSYLAATKDTPAAY